MALHYKLNGNTIVLHLKQQLARISASLYGWCLNKKKLPSSPNLYPDPHRSLPNGSCEHCACFTLHMSKSSLRRSTAQAGEISENTEELRVIEKQQVSTGATGDEMSDSSQKTKNQKRNNCRRSTLAPNSSRSSIRLSLSVALDVTLFNCFLWKQQQHLLLFSPPPNSGSWDCKVRRQNDTE